jgi:CheY-like chemotaxis protein
MALLEANIKHVNSNVEIILAESAEEGLYHFFTNKFDLIFLDIMMPVIDGNDFIAIVEKNIAKKNIPNRTNIVVQTALQSIAQLTTLAKKECVQEIIRKPISLTRIAECIERYCLAHTNH